MRKIDFGFLIGTILAIFDLPVTCMLPIKFRVNLPFGSGEEEINRLSRWPPSWISDRINLSYFYLQITQKLPIQSTGLLVQKKKWKINFQDGHHLGIPIGTILLFFIYKLPRCFLPSFESIGLPVQKKKRKRDFEDGHYGGNLGFPIGMIWAIFDLQVNLMIPTKFQVNWPFGSGEKAKIDFQDGRHGGIEFPKGKIFAIFDLQVTLMLPTKFQGN